MDETEAQGEKERKLALPQNHHPQDGTKRETKEQTCLEQLFSQTRNLRSSVDWTRSSRLFEDRR
jgi:hypothetical protein